MTEPIHPVAVIGGGQLGSRHLQGLIHCRRPLEIHVVDPDGGALRLARQRWSEAGGPQSPHATHFQTGMESLPDRLDLAIVSTTAAVRPDVVEQLDGRSEVGSWLLEKVLAQSHNGLDRIAAAIGNPARVWVNTWARTTPWFQEIRGRVGTGPLVVEVRGASWGMGCNAIHFMDLFAWWTGENSIVVDGAGLDHCWPNAKRAGHHELSGLLRIEFSSGTTLLLRSTAPPVPGSRAGTDSIKQMVIQAQCGQWNVHEPFSETAGSAVTKSGERIDGRVEYQSERTGPIVDSILETGTCDLPDLATSSHHHQLLLAGLLEVRPNLEGVESAVVPIT